MKTLTLATATLAALAFSTGARANAVGKLMIETPSNFHFTLIGARLTQDQSHALTDGAFWPTAVSIEEDYGTISNDEVTIGVTTTHHTAPHGEPPNLNALVCSFTASSKGWKKGDHRMVWNFGSVAHANHSDIYRMDFVGNVYHGTFFNGFGGYVMIVSGLHDQFPEQPSPPPSGLVSGNAVVPPVETPNFGAARVTLHPSNGTADIHLATTIQPHWVLGAELCIGRRGSNGDVALSLDNMGVLNPVGELGSALAAFEVPLPPHVYAAIDQGRAYVQVRTLQFPLGEVRADLRRDDPAPIFPGVTID
jgi:hypothetical protein